LKFHLSPAGAYTVTAVGEGWIRIGATEYRENVVLTPSTVRTAWAAGGFDALATGDFESLLDANPEVVLLGTGRGIRFPDPGLTRLLAAAGVGIEVMDTAAACRTYNILAAEGRRVVAALIVAP
jgi:uncharacterized protein